MTERKRPFQGWRRQVPVVMAVIVVGFIVFLFTRGTGTPHAVAPESRTVVSTDPGMLRAEAEQRAAAAAAAEKARLDQQRRELLARLRMLETSRDSTAGRRLERRGITQDLPKRRLGLGSPDGSRGGGEGVDRFDAMLADLQRQKDEIRGAVETSLLDSARKTGVESPEEPGEAAEPVTVVGGRFTRPREPFLVAGTSIPIRFTSVVTSEVSGPVGALVTANIYSSNQPRVVLIPRGSRVLGRSSAGAQVGQRRLVVFWERVIFQDGTTLWLEEVASQAGDGASGVLGKVNNHWLSFYGHAFITAIAGAGGQLAQPRSSSSLDTLSAGQALAAEFGTNAQEVTSQVASRNLEREPTIKVEAGVVAAITMLADVSFAR